MTYNSVLAKIITIVSLSNLQEANVIFEEAFPTNSLSCIVKTLLEQALDFCATMK